MNGKIFAAAKAVWVICTLMPTAVFIVLKNKKLADINFFCHGLAAAFLTGAAALLSVIIFNQLSFLIFPIALILLCLIYFSGCLDDNEAVSLTLGMSQLFITFQAFWAVVNIDEIMHADDSNVCACHYERVNYHSPAAFIAAALARTAAAAFIAFAVKKIFTSEKLSRTKTVALSAAASAAGLAADVFIFVYFIF